MGQPLIGKKAISGFFGTGWRKVNEYIRSGAPIIKGDGQNSTYEADRDMLEGWWKNYIHKKIEK